LLPTTREWVSKAEGDFDVVSLLLRSRKRSRYDPICFHVQQCAEKYLKARLIEAGIPFPKTHDLPLLVNVVVAVEPLWAVFASEMKVLTWWGVLPRYPGKDASAADSREALKICRKFRAVARQALGLKP
jgi:HEPN domain-containing protein